MICGVGWAAKGRRGTLVNWSHVCIRKPKHKGKHVCACKSWKRKRGN